VAHEDTQYLKLSTFLSTFHKAMATTKANVILKDAMEWLDEHGTDFATSHSRKDTCYIDNGLFGLGSRHGVSKHMVVGHDNLTCVPKVSLRGHFDKNPAWGCPGDVEKFIKLHIYGSIIMNWKNEKKGIGIFITIMPV
jgi:hypothetical protein